MIKGIGVDIIEIPRVKDAIKKWDKDFLKKILTPDELKYCNFKKNKFPHIAVRFAAKEAFLKALGDGWQGKLKWNDIGIANDKNGRPFISLNKKILKKLNKKIGDVHVSLTHNKEQAVAFVVIE